MPNDSRSSRPDLRFYGEHLVFEPAWGLFYRTSPAGAFLLRALASGTPAARLPGLLAARYRLDESRAARDVELFLGALRPLALIPEERL